MKLEDEQDGCTPGSRRASWSVSFRGLCVRDGQSGSQEPICEGLQVVCAKFSFVFQSILRVAREATEEMGQSECTY